MFFVQYEQWCEQPCSYRTASIVLERKSQARRSGTSKCGRTKGCLLSWTVEDYFDGTIRPGVRALLLIPEAVVSFVPETNFLHQKKTFSQVLEPLYDHQYKHHRSYPRPSLLLEGQVLYIGIRYEQARSYHTPSFALIL